MVYSTEDIYHALKIRVLGRKVSGTLFYSVYNIEESLRYWGGAKCEGYYTNPWAVLNKDIVSQMDKDVLKVFSNLLKIYNPPFTLCEQQFIIVQCKKFRYMCHIYDNHIYI